MDPDETSVLITGATGFIGHALAHKLAVLGFGVRATVRTLNSPQHFEPAIKLCTVEHVNAQTSWQEAIGDAKVVIHLVSGTERTETQSASLLDQYRAVNVAGTQSLATASTECGVRHFIFVSTIKVNGEQTTDGISFTETDIPRPQDAYAQSKWEAEQFLLEYCRAHDLMLTILRPPIVYGPGVKGNFLSLMKALQRRLPLPLASIKNQRSMIYIGNLVDAIVACIDSKIAGGKTYLVSDGEDMSTPELIRGIARALDVPPRLFALPVPLLRAGCSLIGRSAEAARLTDSLQVDTSRIRRELGWHPPFSVGQGLEETARWYLKAGSGKR